MAFLTKKKMGILQNGVILFGSAVIIVIVVMGLIT